MNHKNPHSKQLPGWAKWVLSVFGLLILLVVAVRISLNMQPVHQWVKGQIVAVANEQLNVQLSVAELTGDLWKEVTLTGITLTEEDTVMSVDTLSVTYDLLSYFSSVFEVEELRISQPYLKLRQQGEQWNASTWMKPSEQPASPQDTSGFPVRIGRFALEQGKVDVRIPGLQKDSVLVFNRLNLAGSIGYYGESFEITVSDFSFRVEETRLASPPAFQAQARASEHFFSLEKLVLATGNSLIESAGELNTRDSTARLTFRAEPLAWRDIAAYVDRIPVRHNLQADLDVGGNLKQFNIGLRANAHGISGFGLGADVRWDSTITLTGAWLKAEELNLAEFLGDTALPYIRELDFEVNGEVPVNDYQRADLEGAFSISRITQGAYGLERTEGTLGLKNQNLSAGFQLHQQDQRLSAGLQIDNIWSQPYTHIHIEASDMDPAYWMQDTSYAGSIFMEGNLSGKGFYPDTSLWDYSFRVTDSRMMNQTFAFTRFEGQFSREYASNSTAVIVGQSEVFLEAEVSDLQAIPRFGYHLSAHNINLEELEFTDSLSTAITATVSGEGRGNTPENLRLSSTFRIDSSTVSGEYIERFLATVNVADTVATIEGAALQSTIAAGTLAGRMHLTRWFDPENNLELDVEVKDVESLAPLAGVEELKGTGVIRGTLHPYGEDTLVFAGNIDFSDINYGNIFVADQTEGNIEALMTGNPEYVLDLSVSAPVISSIPLQDLGFKTKGRMSETSTSGDFQLRFSSSTDEGHVVHSGTYRVTEDSASLHTTFFELASSARTLSLRNPFTVDIDLAGLSVRMDTMRIEADDGTALELAAEYTDSLNQRGYLLGHELNLTTIQNMMLGEAYVKGILSGDMRFNRSDTTLSALGSLMISQLDYQGTQFDTLRFSLDIGEGKLAGGMEAIYEHQKLIEGKLHMPFELGNPEEFSPEFFERPVEGYLRVNAISLNRFGALLEQYGIDNTQGILQFTSTLRGTAGSPEFGGALSLNNAVLSGVEVDSLSAGLDYSHDTSRLLLNASVNSLGQNAADIEAEIPFYLDLKRLDVNLPGETDSIFADIQTNNFNLAALNDFVDQQQVREIEGQLNGNVRIRGPRNNLQALGTFVLDKGAFHSVQAGIDVDRIHSLVLFEPGVIRLSEFRAESGRGYVDARGTLELARLLPGEMNFSIEARNFRAANTANYSAIIDMDTRVAGTFTRPDIAGELTLVNGFVELSNFGEKSVENVELDDTLATETDTVSVYDSLSIGMNVSFGRGFYIRNQQYLEMEIELEGEVDLQKKENEELQMFGSLNTAGGYAEPLGKRFELEEGAIAFAGPPANPELNIRTLYEPPQPEEEVKIWYIIEGTVENPQFRYESQPDMELENIISYTLFGQPFYALDSWKQVVASSGSGNTTAADIALEVLMDRVETLATQRLGIDVVRIDNIRVGNENGTAITTGWYLNPRVFFAIQNIITGSAPDTSFLLEYLLSEDLKLIISQGNDSRQGIDLRWKFDY